MSLSFQLFRTSINLIKLLFFDLMGHNISFFECIITYKPILG